MSHLFHLFYVVASYAFAALIVALLIGWIWLDGRARRKELAALDAAGHRRRSARPKGSAL